MLSNYELYQIFTTSQRRGMKFDEAIDNALRAVAEAAVKDAVGGDKYAASADEYLRARYGAYRAHHEWRALEDAFKAGALHGAFSVERVGSLKCCLECGYQDGHDAICAHHETKRPQASAAVPHQIAPADVPMHWRDESSNACAYAAGFNACIKLLAASQPEVKS